MRENANREKIRSVTHRDTCGQSFLLHDQPFRSNETPFLFGSGTYDLFGVLHRPPGMEKETGILVCPPLFTEAMEVHGVLVNMARLMAENGYPVLRMDYRGCGESDGEWGDASVPEYVQDLGAGIAALRERTGVHLAGFLGLRMGATLALMKLAEDTSPGFAVAIEPVIRGERYARELLRLNMAGQLRDGQSIKTGLRGLIQSIEHGEAVAVAEFSLNRKQYNAIAGIDLTETVRAIRSPVALFSLRNHQAQPEPVRELFEHPSALPAGSIFREIECPPFWRQTPRLVRRIPDLFDAVIDWLNDMAISAGQI